MNQWICRLFTTTHRQRHFGSIPVHSM